MLGIDPKDPEQNLSGTTTYLAQLIARFKGNTDQAILAYGGFKDPTAPDAQSFLAKVKAGDTGDSSSLRDMFSKRGVALMGIAVLLVVSGIWVMVNSASKS
jgi:hypothetical protein